MPRRVCRLSLWGASLAALTGGVAVAQDRLQQGDPSVLQRALPAPPAQQVPEDAALPPVPGTPSAPPQAFSQRIASAIIVDGGDDLPRARFSDAIRDYIGRPLSDDDLAALARAVADIARGAGFPLASARVEAQSMTDAVLHVKLDIGTITAVRVIGAINPLADAILTSALVNGGAVRSGDLERAILLVGDIPGVTVKDSKYIRQDGFGILLVTIVEDKASAYAQIDNRGSAEIGPMRTTLLASVRDVAGPGDDLSLISAQTPFDPDEFFFIRGRYSTPLDSQGTVLSGSASYGIAHPGASLAPLRVVGTSIDASIGVQRPLQRRRAFSLWGSLELRALSSDQTLLDAALRNDRLATLTASLIGSGRLARGTMRAELSVVGGLPLPGVSREGDPNISRRDGDARFVTWGYQVDWTTPLAGNLSMLLSSQGQLASRPLLSTAELGVGGSVFGRAYDFAERTGDNGILGSGELRLDAARALPGILTQLQLYASVDGGYVHNLRAGTGGGALLSTAGGVRFGRGRLGGMVEVAFPLTENRFDTANREPRVSFRMSRSF